MIRSKQGINIAFVGINHRAQVACAEYLKHTYEFKRMGLDDPIKTLIRSSYGPRRWTNIPWAQRLDLYDAIYKADPEMFISSIRTRMKTATSDTVIWDVRYVNEMMALKEMGFVICRVTLGARPQHLKKYVGKAEKGTTAVAMVYDSTHAFRKNVDYSIEWSIMTPTKSVVDPFLERIGYQLDN